MDVNGHICTEPAYDQFGRLIGDNPKYRRSRCLNSLSPIIPPENRVTLVIEAKVAGGYLTCHPDAEDNVIRTTRTQVRPIQVHTLEKVSNDESGDFFEMQDHFYPMLHKMLSSKQDWKTAPYIRGRPDFEVGIMEWTESILLKFEQPLKQAGIYGAVGVSRYPYYYFDNTWKAFLELWGPLTNTLHHGAGEMSLSLYDLKIIGGLPILGVAYEEFIPEDAKIHREDLYPATLSELLCIHSRLTIAVKQKFVRWDEWLAHFYRGKVVYTAFGENTQQRGYARPTKLLYSPLALQVSREGELAAFLAFWLSRFVLPSYSYRIRPEAFYMASLMAQGSKVSLAPTVLGHIYHGLGAITTDRNGPGKSHSCFPLQYVIGWLGEHFPCLHKIRDDDQLHPEYPRLVRYAGVLPTKLDITSARRVFRTEASVLYHPNPFVGKGGYTFDTENLRAEEFEFLVCLRSGLLLVRVGDERWLEPYYPNRFARQFGYDQGIPSNKLQFGMERRINCNIEDLARAQAKLLRRETGIRFYIPRSSYEGRCTSLYCRWWLRACAPYLGRSVSHVYVTLKKRSLEKPDNIFVIKSLRDVSYNLQRDTQFPDLNSHDSAVPAEGSTPNMRESRRDHSRKLLENDECRIYRRPRQRKHSDSHDSSVNNHMSTSYESNDGDYDVFTDAPHDNDYHGVISSIQDQTTGSVMLKSVIVVPETNSKVTELNAENTARPLQETLNTNPTLDAVSSPSREKKIDASPERDSPTQSGATPLIESDKEEEFSPTEVVTSLPDFHDPATYDHRKAFVTAEINSILEKLNLHAKEILPHRGAILESFELLRPIVKRIGTDEIRFESFAEKVDETLVLVTQLSHGIHDVNDPAKQNTEHIQDLICRHEESRTTEEAIALKLSDLESQHTTLLATEDSIKKEEARVQQMRMAFESSNRNLVEKIKILVKSSEDQRRLTMEFSQARVKAEEERLQELEKIKDSNKSQERKLADLVESLKSYRA